MKYNRNPLYNAVHYTLAAGVATSLVGVNGVALAQDDEEAAELERVEVTGSRIKRVDVEGANPVVVLDRADIERTGLKDLGSVIQQLPSFTASPINTQTNNGGTGGTLIDLRGFGSNRTLVLINGKRSNFAGDLSTIPTSIVERVEILKDGASAIYGADAVAGVVNIITRSDYQGAEFQAQYQNYLDPGEGERNISFLFGGNTDRGNFVMGAEYTDIEGITQGEIEDNPIMAFPFTVLDPDAFRNNPGVADNPGVISLGSSRIPQGAFDAPQFDTTQTLRMGEDGNDPGDFRPAVFGGPNNDTYNYAPPNFMQTPVERISAFAQGRYELFDGMDFFAEMHYQNRRSSQQLAPVPFDTNFDPGFPITLDSGRVVQGIAAENVFNPFGHDITRVRRRVVEGSRSFFQEDDNFQVIAGFEGSFQVGGRFFDYEVSYNYSRSNSTDTDVGQFLGSRLQQAMGPSFINEQGEPTCGTPDNPVSGCVPINFFGGPGSITDEMLDFVSKPVTDQADSQQQVINATLSGDLFDLPAGPLSFAAGFENRQEDLESIPAAAKAIDAVTGNTFEATRGDKALNSYFVELNIPLLADLPFVQRLEGGFGLRQDSFDEIDASPTSVQGSLRWQVNDDILVRGTFSEVFREPGIFELFAGQSDSFPTAGDPCSDFSQLTSAQIQNCVNTGVPSDGSFTQADNQPRSTVGGNPGVQPESGEVFTAGVAWSPGFVDGLTVTLDYWNIELDDSIGALSAQTILNECAFNGQFCDRINRFPDGTINNITATNQNLGSQEGEGVDLEVAYDVDTAYGLFSNRLLTSYLAERKTQPFPGADFVDQDGNFDILQAPTGSGLEAAFPHWQVNYDMDWSYGDWGVSYHLEWIDSLTEFGSPFGIFPASEQFKVDDQFYHDITARYHLAQTDTSLEVGVTNLADNEAPFINQGFNGTTDESTYRVLGRSIFFRVTQRF